jgi:hypothetical protein
LWAALEIEAAAFYSLFFADENYIRQLADRPLRNLGNAQNILHIIF